ncbi:MAG: hypothetical protein V4478_03330 [Patescibacteria group bacterium]
MSIQIQPQQNFAIVRQLPDPSDVATYYVRCEIRNAQTDAIIPVRNLAYLNMTDKGSRRFIGIFQAPADVHGQGLLISVKTTVYTDSGYTTKSDTYNEEMETYLVLERFNPNEVIRQMGPALGGEDIDYKKIEKMIIKAVKENLPEEQEEKTDETVIRAIGSLEKKLADISILVGKIESPKETIEKAPETKIEASPDFSPVTDTIKETSKNVTKALAGVLDVVQKVQETLYSMEEKHVEDKKIKKAIETKATHDKRAAEIVNGLTTAAPVDHSARAKELING